MHHPSHVPFSRVEIDLRPDVVVSVAGGDASPADLLKEADRLRKQADAMVVEATRMVRSAAIQRQVAAAGEIYSTLTFAATERCECGAGMAHAPCPPGVPLMWDCSAVLMGIAARNRPHAGEVPHCDRPIDAEPDATVATGPTDCRPGPTTRGPRPVTLQA